MFLIDFTKPWLYDNVVYFNQGNLSTNNTARCKIITGGDDNLENTKVLCTFKTKEKEIHGIGNIIDYNRGLIDIVFPSNALTVGENKLEIILKMDNGRIAQSPIITYSIWQGLTTDRGVEDEEKFPLLVRLLNTTEEALKKANYFIEETDEVISEAKRASESIKSTFKIAEDVINGANKSIEEVQQTKIDLETKIDNKIKDINNVIAAGTQDLEVKVAREDSKGITHDTLKQRLDADLKIEEKSLKDFVIDMNNMKETQDFAYKRDSNSIVCKNTKNGVVKDLKIKGRTIKGLLGNDAKIRTTLNNSQKSKLFTLSETIPSNTDIYIRINVTAKRAPINGLKINVQNEDGSYDYFDGFKGVYEQSIKIRHTKQITKLGFYMPQGEFDTDASANISFEEAQVTLFDVGTTYIEGITSVGNGNEIEVLSCNSGNLLDKSNIVEGGYILRTNGTVNKEANSFYTNYFIEVVEGMKLYAPQVCIYTTYDKNKSFIGGEEVTSAQSYTYTIPKNVKYIKLSFYNRLNVINDLFVSIKNEKPSNLYKSDKKTILYKDKESNWKPLTELRGINENIYDSIEMDNNEKYWHHKRTEKITLNGDEDWRIDGGIQNQNNTIAFSLEIKNGKQTPGETLNVLNDKFVSVSNSSKLHNDKELFGPTNKNKMVVCIRLIRSKLSSQDIEGFKKWLKSNPVTVIYQLAEEEVYEVNPLNLESYDNETLFLLNTNILTSTEFKITSNIVSLTQNIQKRVANLEDLLYKNNLANLTVALNALDTKLRLDKLESPKQ